MSAGREAKIATVVEPLNAKTWVKVKKQMPLKLGRRFRVDDQEEGNTGRNYVDSRDNQVNVGTDDMIEPIVKIEEVVIPYRNSGMIPEANIDLATYRISCTLSQVYYVDMVRTASSKQILHKHISRSLNGPVEQSVFEPESYAYVIGNVSMTYTSGHTTYTVERGARVKITTRARTYGKHLIGAAELRNVTKTAIYYGYALVESVPKHYCWTSTGLISRDHVIGPVDGPLRGYNFV